MSLLGSDVHLSGDSNDGFSPGSWLCRLCSRQPMRRCEQGNLGRCLHVRHSTARKSSTIVTVSTPKSAGIMPSSGRHRQGRYCVRGGALSYSADTRKESWERIIAKGKWSCAQFPKRSRPTWGCISRPSTTLCITSPTSFCHFLLAGGMQQTHESQKRISCKKTEIPVPCSKCQSLRWCNAFEIISCP